MAAVAPQIPAAGHGGQQEQTQVRLVSADNIEFLVPVDVARVSVTIRTMLDDLAGPGAEDEAMVQDGNYQNDVIPLANVNGDTLRRVIVWATQHQNDTPTEDDDDRNERRTDDIAPWDVDFLSDLTHAALFDLILAANFLDIKGLLDCTCKTVANMIKGKTPEVIRQIFGIENDFTPAEEEQIRKENEWCEER